MTSAIVTCIGGSARVREEARAHGVGSGGSRYVGRFGEVIMLFLFNHQRRSEAFLGVGKMWDPGGVQDWICVVGLCLGEATFAWRVGSPVRALQLRHVSLAENPF